MQSRVLSALLYTVLYRHMYKYFSFDFFDFFLFWIVCAGLSGRPYVREKVYAASWAG